MATFFWGASSLPAFALDPILPTAEVVPGMTGTAYTVVDNTKAIRDFAVDIVGTVDNGKGSTPMIMARATGPVVEQAGGILQGMSGSPVYVDGRLVGAVAAGLKDMTPYTFFITPIEDMLPLWSMPDTKNKTHIKTFDLKKYAADKAKKAEEAKKKEAKTAEEQKKDEQAAIEQTVKDTAAAQDVHKVEAFEDALAAALSDRQQTRFLGEQAPFSLPPVKGLLPGGKLFGAGFDAAGMKFLAGSLGLKADALSSAGGASDAGTDYAAELYPGSPVGVALVCGDFTVGATGTVTATDGNRILAFGHPFLHKGNVNYFMTDASVVGTIAGTSNGMKIANVGNIIGRISQDRDTGIAGTVGEFPSVVPMKIKVEDTTLGRTDTYGARIAYDEDYLAQLVAGLAYASMSKTSDTLGESTATLGFTIRTNAAQGGSFSRENMFYNTTDVGQVAISELMQAMGIICADTDKEADIIDVQVNVKMQDGRKSATLVSATPERTTVAPGETVNIRVVLKPYREAKQTLTIPFTVPKAQMDGTLALDVRGGGMVPVSPLLLLQQATGLSVQSEDEKAQTTADKLKELGDAGKNNEIIIAPGAAAQPLTEKEQRRVMRAAKEAAKRAAAKEKKHPQKLDLAAELKGGKAEKKTEGQTKFATDYLIDNVIHTTLKVDHRVQPAPPAAQPAPAAPQVKAPADASLAKSEAK